jgi:hypothetical protein
MVTTTLLKGQKALENQMKQVPKHSILELYLFIRL